MKAQHDTTVHESGNPSFEAILRQFWSRRQVMRGGLVTAGAALFAGSTVPLVAKPVEASPTLIGFQGIPVSTADQVVVPAGYTAQVLYAWGDPISDGPAFKSDASNTADEQMHQAGMHHDGMQFFPLPLGSDQSTRGLLAVNHEYTDDGLLHAGGMEPWTPEKVAKSQAAHGVSIIEIAFTDGKWQVVRPSRYARRITARTPMRFSGAAAGHALLQTAADPTGQTVLGTLNNCASGLTPWGTYLTCEENFNSYFVNPSGEAEGVTDIDQKMRILKAQSRYGIAAKDSGYRWHEHDERFDAGRHVNEPNRFGWIVEIDPFNPDSQPVKHTALGRFKHENAAVTLAPDNRVVIYMGDDARGEYIYKFVSEASYTPVGRAANMRLLDRGVLYVAKFQADGSGEWLPLVHGQRGFDATAGFSSQAEVLIQARAAADHLGATPMDRPEWVAVQPSSQDVYCTLTNNSKRGTEKGPAVDAANPRQENVYGHIVRWRERGSDPSAVRFNWNIFVLCGDPSMAEEAKKGNIEGDLFGSPDGLWIDARGVLWIQTDVSTNVLNQDDYVNMGNNQMLAANPTTLEIRRFLTGPKGCEITGVASTPDGRTLFVNIQHPGEAGSETNPADPTAVSTWPDGGRPRSATLAIRKDDGGLIGS